MVIKGVKYASLEFGIEQEALHTALIVELAEKQANVALSILGGKPVFPSWGEGRWGRCEIDD